MKAVEYIAEVKDGKVPAGVSQAIRDILAGMSGKSIVIRLSEYRKRRSLKQNRFYFGIVVPLILDMFTEAGNNTDEDEVHEYLKEHVGKLVTVMEDPSGVRHKVVRSSRSLTTAEWEDYITKIRAWAAEFGIAVPMPNETAPEIKGAEYINA